MFVFVLFRYDAEAMHDVTDFAKKFVSLMHTGKHLCKDPASFELPYDIWWLKQHNMVGLLQQPFTGGEALFTV